MVRQLFIVLLLVLGLGLQGCWNRREVDQLAIVMGVGIDKAENGQVKLTTQIARPEAMGPSGGGMGGVGGGGGGQVQNALVINTQGETVFDAVRNAIFVNSRRLFFSHIQLLVIGERFAKSSIAPALDFFERDPELRAEIPIVVASGEVEKVFQIPGNLEKTSSFEIHNALEAASRSLAKIHLVRLHDFLLKYNSESKAAFVPVIKIQKVKQTESFKLNGMAVFFKDKMVGLLNSLESRGLLWILGEVKSGIVVLELPESKGKISIELTGTKTNVEAKIEKGKPVFTVKIDESGNIGEQRAYIDITKPGNMAELQKLLEQQTKKEVTAAISKAQTYKADIFGFGEELHRQYPKQWKTFKGRWPELFSKAKLKVVVKPHIKYSGDKASASQFEYFKESGR